MNSTSPGASRTNREEHHAAHITTKATTQRQLVFAHVAATGTNGATRHEIATTIQRPLSSVCGRIRELIDAGDIVETDQRRRTGNGGSSVVLIAADFVNQKQVRPQGIEAVQPVETAPTTPEPKTDGDDGYRLEPEPCMPDVLPCTNAPRDASGALVVAGCDYLVRRPNARRNTRVRVADDPTIGELVGIVVDAVGERVAGESWKPLSQRDPLGVWSKFGTSPAWNDAA
ncbi:MAG: hypothetical protein AAFP90_20970 [Planctomycetota bacterium]